MNFKKIALFFLLILATERFCHWQTGGFRVAKIAKASEGQNFGNESFFNQPYDFLGSGAQFYAFGSRDGQYVLKFFKTHHGMVATAAAKEKRRSRLFRSAELARSELLTETAILEMHLSPTKHTYGKITLYDRLKIAHQIDLDTCAFVVQKRAVIAEEYLEKLIKTNQLAQAQRAIAAMLDLTEKTVTLGIKNKDIHLMRNCGFIEETPLIIDFGSISSQTILPNESIKTRKKAAQQVKNWLKTHYPQLRELNRCVQ